MFRIVWGGIKSLLRPAARNAEIADEVRSFFELAVEHRMRQGMNRPDAERAARAEIRGAEMVRHNVWASAGRPIRRSPGLSLVAVLSLALGIGGNTAIFTVINDLMLKQLPVRDPEMLVSFWRRHGRRDHGVERPWAVHGFSLRFLSPHCGQSG